MTPLEVMVEICWHWRSPRKNALGRTFFAVQISLVSHPIQRDQVHFVCFLGHQFWIWITLWQFNIAIEHDHRNSGFSHWKWWFSIAMLVYQRVLGTWSIIPRSSFLWHPVDRIRPRLFRGWSRLSMAKLKPVTKHLLSVGWSFKSSIYFYYRPL